MHWGVLGGYDAFPLFSYCPQQFSGFWFDRGAARLGETLVGFHHLFEFQTFIN